VTTTWQARLRRAFALRDEESSEGLGLFPALCLVSALGLAAVVAAYNCSRFSGPYCGPLRWAGLLLTFCPLALRLLSPAAARRERLGLALALGVMLYLTRVLYSPLEFQFSDELQHLRTARDIVATGRLFNYNHILPISPLYPGLECIAVAISQVCGLSLYASGVLVIGAARIVFVLALFVLYERASGSDYVAGLASMLYMCNPHYLSFASMFIYQSLALPLSALTMLAMVQAGERGDAPRALPRLTFMLGLLAVATTHHLTSHVLLMLLALWALLALAQPWLARLTRIWRRPTAWALGLPLIRRAARWVRARLPEQPPLYRRDARMTWITFLGLTLTLAWIVQMAPATISYLGKPIVEVGAEMVRKITAEAAVGESYSGSGGPRYETLITMASVGVISLALLPGIWWIWRARRDDSLAMTLAVGSLGYYGSLVLRLAGGASELAGRTWPFIFVAVAFTLAQAVVALERMSPIRLRWALRAAEAGAILLIFLAANTGGWPPYWGRLPGPYLVAASERSIEPEGVMAAEWAGEALPPASRMTTDFSNYWLMGAYGGHDPVFGVASIFYRDKLGEEDRKLISYMAVRYAVVDTRLSEALPTRGSYYGGYEGELGDPDKPMSLQALTKFDDEPGVQRIFDSGHIIVYDLARW